MRRLLRVAVMALLVPFTVGCAADPRVEVVSGVVAIVDDAGNNLKSVTDSLNDAIKAAEKDNKPLTEADLKPALDAAEGLQKTGQRLQQYKGAVERFKEGLTKETKEELAEKYRGELRRAVETLYQRQVDLQDAMKRAEKDRRNETALKKLRTKLQNAEGEFQVLTRPS